MSDLFTAANEPAIITGIVALASASVTAAVTYFSIGHKASHDFKLETSAGKIARTLLTDPKWELRSFATFQAKLPGINDDELRQILIRIGAVKVEMDGHEVWGLVSRNPDLVRVDRVDGQLAHRIVKVTINGMQMQQQQQQQQMQQEPQEFQGSSNNIVAVSVDRFINSELRNLVEKIGLYREGACGFPQVFVDLEGR